MLFKVEYPESNENWYLITLIYNDYKITISDPSSINNDSIDNIINNIDDWISIGSSGSSYGQIELKNGNIYINFHANGIASTYRIDKDPIDKLLLLIKEINAFSLTDKRYESDSDHIIVESY